MKDLLGWYWVAATPEPSPRIPCPPPHCSSCTGFIAGTLLLLPFSLPEVNLYETLWFLTTHTNQVHFATWRPPPPLGSPSRRLYSFHVVYLSGGIYSRWVCMGLVVRFSSFFSVIRPGIIVVKPGHPGHSLMCEEQRLNS